MERLTVDNRFTREPACDGSTPDRRLRRAAIVMVSALASLAAFPGVARADDLPERSGARVGISLYGGVAGLSAKGVSTTSPLVGASFRFGGAFTDRVHLYGEFSLAALPGATIYGTSVTAFLGALDLGLQVFILRRLYARAGIGAVDHASLGAVEAWSYPGPHITGGVGYDVYRAGERAFSLEVIVADEFFEGGGTQYTGGYTVALGAGFDWF
jgi:hypothetical protein